jgi:hypothetical protein
MKLRVIVNQIVVAYCSMNKVYVASGFMVSPTGCSSQLAPSAMISLMHINHLQKSRGSFLPRLSDFIKRPLTAPAAR